MASDDSAEEKAARIAEAIAVASDEMDEVLRCVTSYESKLPITTVPDSVGNQVAIRAGIWLYSFRATDDFGEQPGYMQWLWKQHRIWLNEIRLGQRKLDI